MANESKKDFNAMLKDSKDMPKYVKITDEPIIKKYGVDNMYFAPPMAYDEVMKTIPCLIVSNMSEVFYFNVCFLLCYPYNFMLNFLLFALKCKKIEGSMTKVMDPSIFLAYRII